MCSKMLLLTQNLQFHFVLEDHLSSLQSSLHLCQLLVELCRDWQAVEVGEKCHPASSLLPDTFLCRRSFILGTFFLSFPCSASLPIHV